MKNNFKRILAFVLGFLMFLFPAPRASAQIEVVEFSDGSRLTRFAREDLQNVVDRYSGFASTYRQEISNLESRDRDEGGCWLECSFFSVSNLLLTLPGIFLTIVGLKENTGSCIGGGAFLLVSGILIDVIPCLLYPSHIKPLNEAKYSYERMLEIKDWLKRQNIAIGVDESQPLLQGGVRDVPNYFLLFERLKDKVNFGPKPFFTTDRDTNYSQSLRSNGLAGLIRDVAGRLRARGTIITERYYLTRAGLGFEEVSGPRVMPELDIVDVVVDGADEDAA